MWQWLDNYTSRRAILCEAQTVLSSLSDVPNKQSEWLVWKPPSGLCQSGNKCFVIFTPTVANERAVQRRTRNNCGDCVQPFRVIFTQEKYSPFFHVFRTIREKWKWTKHDVRVSVYEAHTDAPFSSPQLECFQGEVDFFFFFFKVLFRGGFFSKEKKRVRANIVSVES